MLKIKNLTKSYHSKKNKVIALNDVSFTLDNKGMTFILGKSGSGKSTLLNLLGGMDCYSDGEIFLHNKSLKYFSENDYDFYRNTYVGFIFQDFNLIEDYNVYDNIILSLKLQQKKIDTMQISKLLKDLELSELKDRKVNELSGGQKQRVAIARALIKNPEIILADEPTGNLDSETSKKIFTLLKKISKERLVIVVSHDCESANIYGDRIIEIKDGKIIKDTNKNNIQLNKIEKKYKIIHSKLPFKDCIYLSFQSLKHKKIKLLFSTLLTSFSLLLLAIFISMANFDISFSETNTIKKFKIPFIQIEKRHNEKYTETEDQALFLNEQDISLISQRLSTNNYHTVYNFFNKSISIINAFSISYETSIEEPGNLYTKNYPIEFVEINEEEDLPTSLIGQFPKENNEIIISNYVADLIIMNGIIIDTKENEFGIPKIFQPKNYEELLNSDLLISIGEMKKIKIVGILDYNTEKYQQLKLLNDSELSSANITRISNDLEELVSTVYNKIFVTSSFIKYYNSAQIDLNNNYTYQIINDTIQTQDSRFSSITYTQNSKANYFDGFNWITTDLNENQMILNIRQLPNFNETDYKHNFDKYIQNFTYNNLIDIEKEFFKNYITEFSNLIGEKVILNIYEYEDLVDTYEFEIIGFSGLTSNDEIQTTFSNITLKPYQTTTLMKKGIIIVENNQNNLQHLFRLFPIDSKYPITTIYRNKTIKSMNIISYFQKYAFQIEIIFILFTILLLSNFIVTSIEYQKKNIGILRAIGCTKKDTIKIFLIEGILIATIASIITSILCFPIIKFLNIIIIRSTSIILEPFIIMPIIFLSIFFTALIIAIIASIIPLYKISKMKPVDAIYNRQ